MRLSPRIAAAVVAVSLLLSTPALTAAPTIETVSSGLRATGITPGGDAVWFGVTIDTFALSRLRIRHAAIVRDTDGDGAVVYELPQISRFSLLFVVDGATGEHAVFRGEGVDDVEHDLRGKTWRAQLADFDVHADAMELLLVRPGEGAWATSAMEGDASDGDGERNGKFRLKVREMAAIAPENPSPQGNVRRGDLLIIIDARTLASAVVGAKE